MILVTFAVPFESAAFRRTPASRGVRILHTGVGADAARVALEMAFRDRLPARVIASGFAGALLPRFRVGDIVGDTAGDGVAAARIASADEVLATAAAKRAFRDKSGAEVVDMETDTIREICTAANVPLTIRRAISDGADDDLGLPPDLLDELSRHPLSAAPRLGWTLLRHGKRRRAFLRLVRDCATAQKAIAEALQHTLVEISGSAAPG